MFQEVSPLFPRPEFSSARAAGLFGGTVIISGNLNRHLLLSDAILKHRAVWCSKLTESTPGKLNPPVEVGQVDVDANPLDASFFGHLCAAAGFPR